MEKAKGKLDEALSELQPDERKISELADGLKSLYEKEERYWRQRSRQIWLALGDKNSSFFHSSTRGRGARNRFYVLEDEEGKAYFEEDQITKVITDYFQKLFTAEPRDSAVIIKIAIKNKVTTEMNKEFTKIPDNKEIKKACFNIHGDKAPV